MNTEGPKIFDEKSVSVFLSNVEWIFKASNAPIKESVILDLSKTKKVTILGILLIYKYIDYTYVKLDLRNHTIYTNDIIINQIEHYGFTELINQYIKKRPAEREYQKLNIQMKDSFFVAPQPLLRSNDYSETTLKNRYYSKIAQYYSGNSKTSEMIFTCLSEVLLNFWEHAVLDTQSIIVAEGNKYQIRIACADTGDGIISTLGKSLSNENLSDLDIISMSVEKGATSKKLTNHMGYGLWILNEITKLVKGKLNIYSEGVYLINNYGSIKVGKCGFWKGTIIYLSLPLRDPKTLIDIENIDKSKLDEIKIKFS